LTKNNFLGLQFVLGTNLRTNYPSVDPELLLKSRARRLSHTTGSVLRYGMPEDKPEPLDITSCTNNFGSKAFVPPAEAS
jgi:hypothetical protein